MLTQQNAAQTDDKTVASVAAESTGEAEDRITSLAPSFIAAALEFQRQKMSEKGYRLANRIQGHRFMTSDGRQLDSLFDGQVMYAVTFVKD